MGIAVGWNITRWLKTVVVSIYFKSPLGRNVVKTLRLILECSLNFVPGPSVECSLYLYFIFVGRQGVRVLTSIESPKG